MLIDRVKNSKVQPVQKQFRSIYNFVSRKEYYIMVTK